RCVTPHPPIQLIEFARMLGIPLQPYIFASRANLVHSGSLANGKTWQARQAIYDLQGHVAELLGKCVATPGMDLPLSKDDLEKFQEMLANFGDLTKTQANGKTTYSYKNQSGRAGYEVPPGVGNQPGRPLSPLALDEILRSHVWNDHIFRDAEYYWQASLMEPVGGMDHFVKGFARQPLARQDGSVEGIVRFGAKVTGLDVGSDKVTIAYE